MLAVVVLVVLAVAVGVIVAGVAFIAMQATP